MATCRSSLRWGAVARLGFLARSHYETRHWIPIIFISFAKAYQFKTIRCNGLRDLGMFSGRKSRGLISGVACKSGRGSLNNDSVFAVAATAVAEYRITATLGTDFCFVTLSLGSGWLPIRLVPFQGR